MSLPIKADPPAASLTSVVKRYGGKTALSELSLVVPRRAICALIGPNGSGKTTTMGVLAGLLRPEAGQVDILGSGPFDVRRHGGRVAIMPQDSVPSPHVPIVESLTYYAELSGLPRGDARREAELWLARVHLGDRQKSRYGTLSHGMRRRYSIAQAMLGSPELILLDEPTSGLDPELVVEVRRIIAAHRGRATVLVSSHILSELEALCDHAIFLDGGRCVRQGPMSEVTGRDTVVRYLLDRRPNIEALGIIMRGCALGFEDGVLTVRAPAERSVVETNADCLRWLLDHGVGILQLTPGESLEAAYLASKDA
jgi:ABC-type multidrug transport system ATPase subunit